MTPWGVKPGTTLIMTLSPMRASLMNWSMIS